MSDQVLKQARAAIEALRRGGDNPNVSEILRVAGVAGAEPIRAGRREEEPEYEEPEEAEDDVPEMQRGQPYPGEEEETQTEPIQDITDDEPEYEEEPEYEDLRGSAAGGRLTHTPPVDIDGESGVEEIVEHTHDKWGRR